MNLLLKTKSNTTGSSYQRFFCCFAADGVSMGHIKSYLVLGVYTFTPSFQIQQTVCPKTSLLRNRALRQQQKKNKKTSKIRCIPMRKHPMLLKKRNLRFPGFARVYLTRNSDRIVIQTPSSAKNLGDLALGIMVRMKSWRSIWDESQSHISKTIQSAKHPSDKMSLKFAVFTCPVFSKGFHNNINGICEHFTAFEVVIPTEGQGTWQIYVAQTLTEVSSKGPWWVSKLK